MKQTTVNLSHIVYDDQIVVYCSVENKERNGCIVAAERMVPAHCWSASCLVSGTVTVR
jgi:hypothetical protein